MSRTAQRSHKGLSQYQRSSKIQRLARNVKWSNRSWVTERSKVILTANYFSWKVKSHPKIPKLEDTNQMLKVIPKYPRLIPTGQRASWNVKLHSKGQILLLRVKDHWEVKRNPKFQISLKGERSFALCPLGDTAREGNGQGMERLCAPEPVSRARARVMQGDVYPLRSNYTINCN